MGGGVFSVCAFPFLSRDRLDDYADKNEGMDKEMHGQTEAGIAATVRPRLHQRSADVNVTRLLKKQEGMGGG